ncbi:flagellar hook-basal body complex protein FliE, partial [Buchnera aphidicola]|nr:flagellar hook-basal body complex protein FliE [Buchnera aphidicola]
IINSLDEISKMQNDSDINAEKFTLNQSNSSLDDVMIDLQKSSISIQMIIQIRNKVMTAYQDIMNQAV